jgi:sugar lactone lactonase YvrE
MDAEWETFARTATAHILVPPVAPGLKGRTKLGEGAVWDHESARLLWVDIVKGKIFHYDWSSGVNKHVDLRQSVGTVVPHTGDSVVAALSKGVCVIDLGSGRVTKFLGNPERDEPENRWNDGKCDPHGRLWVGSMNTFCAGRTGALYSVSKDGEWAKHVTGVGISNGLVWSSEGRTFWYIDTIDGTIDAFDYTAGTGAIANRRTAVRIDTSKDGHPDGCCIDSQDRIWVAMWGGGCVICYDPATGRELMRLHVPGATQVTSCALGGEKLDQLLVTTASCGLPCESLTIDQRNAGAVFRFDLSALGVKGVPASYFGRS